MVYWSHIANFSTFLMPEGISWYI